MAECTSPLTFTADVQIAQKLRVKIKTGSVTEPPEVDIAGVGERGVGVNQYLVAANEDCAVVPFNKDGSIEMVAAGAFSIGADIYPAAGGKVDDVPSGDKIGTALEAATADGDIVEILPSFQTMTVTNTAGVTSIATTGATSEYVIAGKSGILAGIDFSSLAALAANDTNYITFSVVNLGQDGLGSTAMLAAVDANTTKATGGSAIVANAKRQLTLHATAANLVVVEGDRLQIIATVTGTLGGAVTRPVYNVKIN
jgi:hypothetical protein